MQRRRVVRVDDVRRGRPEARPAADPSPPAAVARPSRRRRGSTPPAPATPPRPPASWSTIPRCGARSRSQPEVDHPGLPRVEAVARGVDVLGEQPLEAGGRQRRQPVERRRGARAAGSARAAARVPRDVVADRAGRGRWSRAASAWNSTAYRLSLGAAASSATCTNAGSVRSMAAERSRRRPRAAARSPSARKPSCTAWRSSR